MTESFDPYRRWLGLPPGERPPNHYTLLGVSLFEDDADAISNAADRQMAYVRTHQTGPHAVATQQILNELAAARVCLLNPAQKAQYDADLKAKLEPVTRLTMPVSLPAPVAVAVPAPLPVQRVEAGVAPNNATAPVPSIVARPAAARGSSLRGSSLRGSSLRGLPRKLPRWTAPAAGGLAAGFFLAWIAMSLSGGLGGGSGGGDRAVRTKASPADASRGAGEAVKPPGGAPPVVSIFKSIERPSPLGVVADKLVIWNTHNGPHNERGTLECNLRLLAGGHEIWSKSGLAFPWAPNEDRSLTMALPRERFDCVRVEITKWEKTSGGLAEIQVFSTDGRNLALGCPTLASGAWSHGFAAVHVTNGVTTSADAEVGYWVLPDRSPGWVEVDLSLPRPAKLAGVTADKLAIWNQHNGPHNNSATQWCDATLYSGERIAWRQKHIELPWAPGEDFLVELKLPQTPFDRVRVDVTPQQGKWAGLAEVQILRHD